MSVPKNVLMFWPSNGRAQAAGWDRETLAIELQALIDLDFEVEMTGFEVPEVDIILDDANEA